MKNIHDKESTPEYELCCALLQLRSPAECEAFLRDLCTPKELAILSERWRVAKLLARQLPYRAIQKETQASLTTISRVARFLWQENYAGYQLVLKRLAGET